MAIKKLAEIATMFSNHGVEIIYFKHLAKKQDNDKNQIYLGSSLEGAANLFPSRIISRINSESTMKKLSKKGTPKLEAKLKFFWILNLDKIQRAPNTKIIDYFQYPEVRLSGFLSSSPNSPRSLRRKFQKEFGKRILCLGSNSLGQTFGYVLTEKEDKIVKCFPDLPRHDSINVLQYISVTNIDLKNKQYSSPRDLLLYELGDIHKNGWHNSIKMKPDGSIIPYKANNGGGYTLEALLGIKPNALKKPDKYGFEIKSHSNGRISLMTPTPDQGDAGKLSFFQFMNKHGWRSKEDNHKLVFTGPFKESVERIYSKNHHNHPHRMTLLLNGYDENGDKWMDSNSINLCLNKKNYSNSVAIWSLHKLVSSWEEKHAQAIYISRQRNEKNQYKFSSQVFVCSGTSIWKLLKATKKRIVSYDPGHDIYIEGHPKYPKGKKNNRPQWRISAAKTKLQSNLEELYEKVELVDL